MSADYFEDTIAAMGTPLGDSAIGVVRVSGPRCEPLARLLFKSPRGPIAFKSHLLHYGRIVDPASGVAVDEVLLTLMRAPRTYTREDVLEIQCHGGAAAVSRVLDLVLANGARPAEPGEFTKRAFLNGRIDLTQAEAVIDVIRSRSAHSLELSTRLIAGELKSRVLSIRDKAAQLLAQVEVAIDFPEEDVEIVQPAEAVRLVMEELLPAIAALLDTFEVGRLYREGVDVVIVGKPNVGKSSLLNCLLQEDRAIVTPHPGTTRDFIEANITLDGLPLRLVDTAGLRETHDEIERMSLEVTRKRLKSADLAVWVLDLSREPDGLDEAVFELLQDKTAIAAANKRDLRPDAPLAPLTERFPSIPMLAVSALYNQGIDELKRAMRQSLVEKDPESLAGPVITRIRHKQALTRCGEHLRMAVRNIEDGMLLDRLAVDLRDALDDLGEIVGLVTTEDVLDRIFSEFCIGK